MLEELLPYYERELTYLRELSGEFAQRYPKIARRLLLDGGQSEDPHVERLIEAFAFLTARIHRKLDDEFPEITEAFMQVLYPHYTQPIPSCTILQFDTEWDKPELSAKHVIERHHPVMSPTVGDVACEFRTCYEVALYPLTLARVQIQLAQSSEYLRRLVPQSKAAITLEFKTHGSLSIEKIKLESLRFFLDGEPSLMHLLYELLTVNTKSVRLSDGSDNPSQALWLHGSALRAVGFAEDEGLLDYDERTFVGYRLLSEYFAFPEKFLFVELTGLDAASLQYAGDTLKAQIFLSEFPDTERHNSLLQTLSTQNFKMGCTPVVNLFKHAATPVLISHQTATYPVTANAKNPLAYEVISIDKVTNVHKTESNEIAQDVPPFYSIRHAVRQDLPQAFWYATRESSVREYDKGTDVALSFVDLNFSPTRPALEILSMDLTCSNRDWPMQLPFGGSDSGTHTDFTLGKTGVVKRAKLLRKPTPSMRPPVKRGLQWRLISHLSLNHLSIVTDGKEALQEMLMLYNFSQSHTAFRQIQGIVSIDSRPCATRVTGKHFSGFVRGIEIVLTIDEQSFVGSGVVLFGSILDRFFSLYCGPNSFTRLTLRSVQREKEIVTWPARSGEAVVI